jgi:hypothetical protein
MVATKITLRQLVCEGFLLGPLHFGRRPWSKGIGTRASRRHEVVIGLPTNAVELALIVLPRVPREPTAGTSGLIQLR